MAAGSNSSNPRYKAKNNIAQTNPMANEATCPTMVIPFVLIRDWITSLDRPLEKDESFTIYERNLQRLATEIYKVKNNLSPKFIQSQRYENYCLAYSSRMY